MRARDLIVFAIMAIMLVTLCLRITMSGARETTILDGQLPMAKDSKSVPSLLNYQGYLATADSGAVNDTLAMTFRLFDVPTGGTALWSETVPAVPVNSGQFYVLLGSVTPFPADLFDGTALYLEMEVGGDVFSPRKPIVSVAYSLRSDRADSAGYATDALHAARADTAAYSPGAGVWTVSGDNVYRLTGNMGLGTDAPTAKLDVVGNVDADGFTINGTPIGTSTDTYWSKTGDNIHYSAGNVGIGTATPTARLQVEDGKGNKSSLCSSDHAVSGEHSSGTKGYIGETEGGVYGEHPTDNNKGWLGGETAGVEGYSDHLGVYGENSESGHYGWIGADDAGVRGSNPSGGTYGFLGGSGDNNYGVGGITFSATGKGVYGYNNGSVNRGWLGGDDYGAYGKNGNGNYGFLGGQDDQDFGVGGIAVVANGKGVYGKNSASNNWGFLGGSDRGAYGVNASGNFGYLGGGSRGAYGNNANGNFGYLGGDNHGAYGQHSSGSFGTLGEQDYAVFGQHSSNNQGCLGTSQSGVRGANSNGNIGSLGNVSNAVYGANSNGNEGIIGHADYAVGGWNNDGSYCKIGVPGGALVGGNIINGTSVTLAGEASGVAGGNPSGAIGALGYLNYGVYGDDWTSGGLAGYFKGPTTVEGHLTKTSGSFKIDHPLDPENKYLYHSLVESPDMMNIYNGNVILDAGGEAWIQLPEWFGALNKDFRYQLTAVGAPGPDLYVAEEISGNRFRIAGGKQGMKVSWQVTGIRQDPWANAHRVPVEEQKPPEERNRYLHPELYGQPEERSVHPGGLSLREDLLAAQKGASEGRPGSEKILPRSEAHPQILEPPILPPAEPRSATELTPEEGQFQSNDEGLQRGDQESKDR